MKKNHVILFLSAFIGMAACAQQTKFSLASDASILRNFKKDQRFWSFGQTVSFHFHFTPTDGAYAWISYYSDGKFKNSLTAMAKQPATNPQQLNYRNSARLRFKHISLGWKKYLKGSVDKEKGSNIYSYAGFGLMMGRIENTHSPSVDSAAYIIPVLNGKANFKRLTLDIGLGTEFPVGGDVFLYFEGKAFVPTTDYPSKYLFVNSNAPFAAALSAGIRILFN